MKTKDLQTCPLCLSTDLKLVLEKPKILYLCNVCTLVFAAQKYLLSKSEERERYFLHDNRIDDQDYLNFLNRLAIPLIPFLNKEMEGLDYGCGQVEAFDYLLKNHVKSILPYDPVFFDKRENLKRKYDFVILSEVCEHFHYPKAEFEKLDDLLRPFAILAVMTGFYSERTSFKDWHYVRDPTHVSFYSKKVMRYIAQIFNFEIIFENEFVVFFRKIHKRRS